jgi:hypothetical protein
MEDGFFVSFKLVSNSAPRPSASFKALGIVRALLFHLLREFVSDSPFAC